MTSRFTLLAGVAGLIWAGCSAPAEDGAIADPPTAPPPGFSGAVGQAGASAAPVATAGAGGGGSAPAPVGAGGSAMVGGSAGSAPVAAAGAGGGGGAAIPSGSGTALTHDATGWVAGTSNGVGIQGSFYTISDATGTPPGATDVALDDLAASPTTVCASGVASEVVGMDYTTFWGGGVALNLADPGGGMPAGAWTQGAVTGFSFTITGPMIPAGFRFNAVASAGGDPYCADIAGGANSVNLTSLLQACYNGATAGPALTSATPLASIQWQVVTAVGQSTPFDFCIENLTALTTP